MDTVPQPLPDVDALPPEVEALRSRQKMNLIWKIGGFSVLGLALLVTAAPFLLKSRKASDRTEALNNIRQIGLGLFEFDRDYGRFPDATTIPEVKTRTSTKLTLDDSSSNMLFRQLLVTGLKSERPFYAKIPKAKLPDEHFNTDGKALDKGECAFSYVAGLSSSSDPATPLVMTPLISGTTNFMYPGAFKEKAILLRVDSSATAIPIKKNGHGVDAAGKDIFDPAQPYWKGAKPNLKWPK